MFFWDTNIKVNFPYNNYNDPIKIIKLEEEYFIKGL